MRQASETLRGRARPRGHSGDATTAPGNSTGEARTAGRDPVSAPFSQTGGTAHPGRRGFIYRLGDTAQLAGADGGVHCLGGRAA